VLFRSAAACRILGYAPPPRALPHDVEQREPDEIFVLAADNRIRLQYCEDHTTRAIDWHAHDPSAVERWHGGDGAPRSSQDIFGHPPREPADAPYTYELKPMVAVSFEDAARIAEAAATRAGVAISLPDESRWERAARGWHANARHPWGDAPARGRADCEAFLEHRVLPSRTFAPNDYGLYAMVGGVWEWCTDVCETASNDPRGPRGDDGPPRALRGGSWADSADACTTSFRMALRSRDGGASPNVACRFVLLE
jgi:formylglycine-generating enzyme required for sulfatase activity